MSVSDLGVVSVKDFHIAIAFSEYKFSTSSQYFADLGSSGNLFDRNKWLSEGRCLFKNMQLLAYSEVEKIVCNNA